ncbi:MAG: phospholipase [bacterium]
MIVNENHIQTTRTARYYSMGSFSEPVDELWIVLHGYGQRAEQFISDFAPISGSGVLIVAPEALSRFYWKGFSGEVTASWMTREDRLNEIQDYINYLDNLYNEILKPLMDRPKRIIGLGFSQGCPTLLRWLAAGNSRVDEIVIWSGDVPRDLAFDEFRSHTQNAEKWLIYSKTDPFIRAEIITETKELLTSRGNEFRTIEFEGGHSIPVKTLLQLKEHIGKAKTD